MMFQNTFVPIPAEVEEYQQPENGAGTGYQQPEGLAGVECNGPFLDQEQQLTRSSSTSDIRDQCSSDIFQGNGNLEIVGVAFTVHPILSAFQKPFCSIMQLFPATIILFPVTKIYPTFLWINESQSG